MNKSDVYIGMRFRVCDAGANGYDTYDDYENGDTGSVRRMMTGEGSNLVRVNWDKVRFADESKETSRCDCLHIDEIEPLENV